ncbi:hypothetical protein RAO21_02895 [Pediococcus acidilactici]
MDNDNDFIMKQVKSFVEGLSYVLGKKRNGDIEVVFKQENQQKNKFFAEIDHNFNKEVDCKFNPNFWTNLSA